MVFKYCAVVSKNGFCWIDFFLVRFFFTYWNLACPFFCFFFFKFFSSKAKRFQWWFVLLQVSECSIRHWRKKKSVFPIERSLHHQQYSCHARHQGEWNLAQDPWSSHVFGDSSPHMPLMGRDLKRQGGNLNLNGLFFFKIGNWEVYYGSLYLGQEPRLFSQIGISGAAPNFTGFR